MTQAPALTRNQALVFGALTKRDAPAGAYDLLDDLRPDGFKAPLQVYRALDKLMELGLAHRLESINAFVACAHPHDHKHRLTAFAICKDCGQVEEFADAVVEERLQDWSKDHAFKLAGAIIELRGTCASCRAS